MPKIAIILGSTRPGRNGEAVANWAYDIAKQRDDAEYELVDIADSISPTSTKHSPRRWASTPTHTPRRGPRRSTRSTASCSSPRSTTTPPPAP
jgi:NADPH-dependent FMN reductase